MRCDNKQTIGLITKEHSTLQTKLRHVDIHNHWPREFVRIEKTDAAFTGTTCHKAGAASERPVKAWTEWTKRCNIKLRKERKERVEGCKAAGGIFIGGRPWPVRPRLHYGKRNKSGCGSTCTDKKGRRREITMEILCMHASSPDA